MNEKALRILEYTKIIDMAAEQKALATYYQLLNLTDDCDLKDVLRFLGQREIVHYQRFGEALMDIYEFTECKKQF